MRIWIVEGGENGLYEIRLRGPIVRVVIARFTLFLLGCSEPPAAIQATAQHAVRTRYFDP